MKLLKTKIKDVYIIKPSPFKDNRGVFRRNYCKDEMKIFMKKQKIVQANLSFNYKKLTLRGFHYQKGRKAEGKLLTCLSGEIYDVVVDLRKKSPTYLKTVKIKLNDKNMQSIFIAKGCANAFLTLKNKTLVHYYCTEKYNPKFEGGVRYNDPALKINWPFKPKIISKKDISWKNIQ